MQLAKEILNLLKKKAEGKHEYINPNFLLIVTEAINDYYDISDPIVDKWVQDMFSA